MALTEIPLELSSTPSIVDNGNATAITIGADESVALGGTLSLPNANATNEISFTGTEFTNVLSATTSGFQFGTTGAGYLQFLTGNTARMTIDGSSGNLLLGTNTTNIATEGTVIYGSGNEGVMQLSSTAMTALYVNRSNDGELVQFRTGGTTSKGTIGTTTSAGGSRFAIGGVGDPGIIFAGTGVFPSAGLTASNGASDLGSASYRWKDLYLSGGAYLGGTAAANKLDSYEEGAYTPTITTSSGSISYAAQQGGYVKVGDVVHYWIRLAATCTATATLYNLSLPFSTSGYNAFFSGPAVGNAYNVTLGTGGTILGAYYIQSNNEMRLHSYGNNTGQLAPSVTANTAFEIRMEGSYRVTA